MDSTRDSEKMLVGSRITQFEHIFVLYRHYSMNWTDLDATTVLSSVP